MSVLDIRQSDMEDICNMVFENPKYEFYWRGRKVMILSTGPEFENYTTELPSGDIRVGMYCGDDIVGVLFSGEAKRYLDKLEPECRYIVVGKYEESEGNGTTYRNIYVQGMLPFQLAVESFG